MCVCKQSIPTLVEVECTVHHHMHQNHCCHVCHLHDHLLASHLPLLAHLPLSEIEDFNMINKDKGIQKDKSYLHYIFVDMHSLIQESILFGGTFNRQKKHRWLKGQNKYKMIESKNMSSIQWRLVAISLQHTLSCVLTADLYRLPLVHLLMSSHI